jgi:hypothetical protein
MNIAQVAAVAAAFEASRVAGTQQSATMATAVTVQRQANRVGADSGLRRTEVVNESDEADATDQARRHKVDIKV